MGWKPALRWDRCNRRWHFRFGGKHYACGRNYAAAVERFRAITSLEPESDRPESVAGAVKAWIMERDASDWQRAAADRLVGYCGMVALAEVKRHLLTRYVEHLRAEGLKPRTVLSYAKTASQILRHAAGRKWIDTAPPMPRLPRPKPRLKSVPAAPLADAFATLPDRAGHILRFVLHTGCRPDEACRLRWADVDLTGGVCELAKHKTDRYGQRRVLYLTAEARAVLESVARTGEHVFVSRLGRPYTPAGLRSILRRRGIAGAYTLRHTFAQNALDRGVDWATLARLMGHADLQTVSQYAAVKDRQAIQAAGTLASPLLPSPPPQLAAGTDAGHGASSSAPRKPRARRRDTR